jgi:hypothetical protein
MTKILDLDALKTEKTVRFGGKDRSVRGMTVDEFLSSAAFDEDFKKADQRAQINMLVDQLSKFISDTTKEELGKLEIPQLSALLNYVRGMDRVEDDAAAKASAEGKA